MPRPADTRRLGSSGIGQQIEGERLVVTIAEPDPQRRLVGTGLDDRQVGIEPVRIEQSLLADQIELVWQTAALAQPQCRNLDAVIATGEVHDGRATA